MTYFLRFHDNLIEHDHIVVEKNCIRDIVNIFYGKSLRNVAYR